MILHGLLLMNAHQPPTRGWLAIEDGRIVEVQEGDPPSRQHILEQAMQGDPLPLISPGFIDAHVHLPQLDSIGYDGMELMEWLDRVIFPAEIRWKDPSFAADQIARTYRQFLKCGTLGFAAFLTSHFHGYEQVVRAGHVLPLRAIVGQSLMDRNAPQELLGHELTRLANSQRSRVNCSVNPRFAVSCSDAMMEAARVKAASVEGGAVVHTHLAENRAECALVRSLFPKDAHYTNVYDRHGLLTSRTLLAHCLHLSDAEWELIARRQSVVVHCPTANTFLKSGVFDWSAATEHGVRMALGSDIAAGCEMSMPRVARAMIDTAKLRAMTIGSKGFIPSPQDAWNMITRGNADALGWTDAGRIQVGAAADLLVIQPRFEFDEFLISRLLYTWRDDYISHRIVNGRFVKPSVGVNTP